MRRLSTLGAALLGLLLAAPLHAQDWSGVADRMGGGQETGGAATAATPEPGGLNAAQQEDLSNALAVARERTLSREPTVRNAEERLELWKMVLLLDPQNVEAKLGFEQAQTDLTVAREQQSKEKAVQEQQDQQAANTRERLKIAERAIHENDLAGAEGILEDIVQVEPGNARAQSLLGVIRDYRKAQEFKRRLLFAAIGLLAVAAILGVWIGKVMKRKKEEAKAEAKEAPTGSVKAKALVKIVDGVGRGKLVPIHADIFRIGAAEGTQPEEKNDLVISDSQAAVSRYHCAIVKKGKRFFLIDSSLNGMHLNGEALARGEHHVLRDGDEFVLARSARVKFLHT